MATKFQPRTVLLIPDTHAMPGDSLDRFDRLSDYLDERALTLDKVVHIGDLWDFESLCTHDMNSPHWYHRSLEKDIEAGFYALDKIVSIAHAWGSTDIEFIEGNHEDRYNKWMASDNRLLTSGFPKTVQQLIRTYKSSVKLISTSSCNPPTSTAPSSSTTSSQASWAGPRVANTTPITCSSPSTPPASVATRTFSQRLPAPRPMAPSSTPSWAAALWTPRVSSPTPRPPRNCGGMASTCCISMRPASSM